jgi:hypothetical protein
VSGHVCVSTEADECRTACSIILSVGAVDFLQRRRRRRRGEGCCTYHSTRRAVVEFRLVVLECFFERWDGRPGRHCLQLLYLLRAIFPRCCGRYRIDLETRSSSEVVEMDVKIGAETTEAWHPCIHRVRVRRTSSFNPIPANATPLNSSAWRSSDIDKTNYDRN